MKQPDDGRLLTPFYIKTDAETPWPSDESAFYMLSRNGLFFCRNHDFFRSSVPARKWPSELAPHEKWLSLNHPKIPRRRFELIVGFFDRIAELHGSEAGAMIVWDRDTGELEFEIPDQTASVEITDNGYRYASDLHYTTPVLGPGKMILGDIHSHVHAAAYASLTDQNDEAHRPGLHIVIGRIGFDPPEVHCEFVVDGTRFPVRMDEVIEGYRRRRTGVPQAWIDRVKIDAYRRVPVSTNLTWRS